MKRTDIVYPVASWKKTFDSKRRNSSISFFLTIISGNNWVLSPDLVTAYFLYIFIKMFPHYLFVYLKINLWIHGGNTELCWKILINRLTWNLNLALIGCYQVSATLTAAVLQGKKWMHIIMHCQTTLFRNSSYFPVAMNCFIPEQSISTSAYNWDNCGARVWPHLGVPLMDVWISQLFGFPSARIPR